MDDDAPQPGVNCAAIVDAMNAFNARIPFNAWLGIKVVSLSETTVNVHMPWRVELAGAPGATHGGVLAGLIDATAYLVLLATNGDGGPTIDMQVDFHRSTANGALSAEGSLVRAGATISTVEVRIRDTAQRLVASGRGMFLTQARKRSAVEMLDLFPFGSPPARE